MLTLKTEVDVEGFGVGLAPCFKSESLKFAAEFLASFSSDSEKTVWIN
jgi:hypothetical protein